MKKFLSLAIAGACLVAFAPQSNAVVLSVGDVYYVGSVNDGVPSNPADEMRYIANLIGLAPGAGDTVIANPPPPAGTSETYNRVNSALAGLSAPEVFVSKDENPPYEAFDVTGNVYIIGKYGAQGAGSLVWYIGDPLADITLPSTYSGNGLSHISVYGGSSFQTPDGGMTLLLLGSALAGLGYVRNRFSK